MKLIYSSLVSPAPLSLDLKLVYSPLVSPAPLSLELKLVYSPLVSPAPLSLDLKLTYSPGWKLLMELLLLTPARKTAQRGEQHFHCSSPRQTENPPEQRLRCLRTLRRLLGPGAVRLGKGSCSGIPARRPGGKS